MYLLSPPIILGKCALYCVLREVRAYLTSEKVMHRVCALRMPGRQGGECKVTLYLFRATHLAETV